MSSLAHRLEACIIGVSVSDAVDAPLLGVDKVAVDYLASQLVHQLLAVGADIGYGGDFRPGGFTEVIGEAVFRYERRRSDGAVDRRLHQYVAWPVAAPSGDDSSASLYQRVILQKALAVDGSARTEEPTAQDRDDPSMWAKGLTSMRTVMSEAISARIVVGGATAGYKGTMPGIQEEALLAAAANKPVYVLGGFGGAARQLLGLPSPSGAPLDDATRARVEALRLAAVSNGLGSDESSLLSETADPDLAIALVLTGLARTLSPTT